MVDSPLAVQLEQLSQLYDGDPDIQSFLIALVESLRNYELTANQVETAQRLRDDYPGSTLSLLLQKVLTGRTDAADQHSLRRWIHATDSEQGPKLR